MNAEWHRSHPMPKRATTERRLQWHMEHDVHCGCRPMPRAFEKELLRRLALERSTKEARSWGRS